MAIPTNSTNNEERKSQTDFIIMIELLKEIVTEQRVLARQQQHQQSSGCVRVPVGGRPKPSEAQFTATLPAKPKDNDLSADCSRHYPIQPIIPSDKDVSGECSSPPPPSTLGQCSDNIGRVPSHQPDIILSAASRPSGNFMMQDSTCPDLLQGLNAPWPFRRYDVLSKCKSKPKLRLNVLQSNIKPVIKSEVDPKVKDDKDTKLSFIEAGQRLSQIAHTFANEATRQSFDDGGLRYARINSEFNRSSFVTSSFRPLILAVLRGHGPSAKDLGFGPYGLACAMVATCIFIAYFW